MVQPEVTALSPEITIDDFHKCDKKKIGTTDLEGFAYSAVSLDDVKSCLARIQAETRVSSIVYAYRVRDGMDEVAGNFDDREWGSSKPMRKLLEDMDYYGILIICLHHGIRRIKPGDRNEVMLDMANKMVEEHLSLRTVLL